MAETELTAAEANALDGSTDSETGFTYHAPGDAQYYTEGQRQRHRLLTLAKALGNRFRVYKDGEATFGVRPGAVASGAGTLSYAGSEENALTDDQTNAIWLEVQAGELTLATSTSGFPDPSATPHLPLATIEVASGSYAHGDITDCRQLGAFRLRTRMTADDENALTDGSNADSLHVHDTAGLADGAVTAAKLASAARAAVPNLDITAGAEAADTRTVTVQARDAVNDNLAGRFLVRVWIATAEYGAPSAAGNTVSVTAGAEIESKTANADYHLISDAAGKVVLDVQVSGAATRYVLAEIDGRVYSSGQLDWAA